MYLGMTTPYALGVRAISYAIRPSFTYNIEVTLSRNVKGSLKLNQNTLCACGLSKARMSGVT